MGNICDRLMPSAKTKMKDEIYLSTQLRYERHLGFDKNYHLIRIMQSGDELGVKVEKGVKLFADFHTHLSDGFIGEDFVEHLEPSVSDIDTNIDLNAAFSCIGGMHPKTKEHMVLCYEVDKENRSAKNRCLFSLGN